MSLLGLSRQICTQTAALCRLASNHAIIRPSPRPRGPITTPSAFLKAIGRDTETKVNAEEWDDFWQSDGEKFRKMGLGVQDRRYIMWCMEKFRQGWEISSFAHPARPKKKVRGHGPAVQFGKRIRSRRMKS